MIRRLTVDDLEAFRELREEAMRLCPESFGSPEEEQGGERQEAAYRDILQKDEILGAFEGDNLIGVIGFFIPGHAKSQKCGRIFTLYVRDTRRNSGLGDRLIKHILAIAADHVEQMHVCIVHTAAAALDLFQKNGFEVLSTETNAFSLGDVSYNELLLGKRFR